MAFRADKADRQMDRAAWLHQRRKHWQLITPAAAQARPLIPPGPRATIFLPLAVLASILPGLYALRHWDLTPPGPWWGMRGLAILEGHWFDQVPLPGVGPPTDAVAYRHTAMQPPLYAWLEAAALWLSGARAPIATVVPSFAAGAVAVLLIFAVGRRWGRPALGLLAAVLTAFNPTLLMQMQCAAPRTLGLATVAAVVWAYCRACVARSMRRKLWWTLVSGLCLALALLAVGPFALVSVAIIVTHRILIGVEPRPLARLRSWRALRPIIVERATPWALGAVAVGCALGVAGCWYGPMSARYGVPFWSAVFAGSERAVREFGSGFSSLFLLAPATTALGLVGFTRAVRRIRSAERGADDPATLGSALWVAWFVVILAVLVLVPERTAVLARLTLLAPLNVLAAQTMLDLADRRYSSRALIWIAPATALSLIWSALPELRGALFDMSQGRRPSAGMSLALHLGFDMLVVMGLAIRGFDRWTRSNDARRRSLIGGFLIGVMGFTFVMGLREVQFRHRETTELLALRDAIVRRHIERPLSLLAVVSSEGDPTRRADAGDDLPLAQPGGRLRFILRSALPNLAQLDLANVKDLRGLPDSERLVVLAGTGARLSYALQARLRLDVLHQGASGVLAAYATPIEQPRAKVARRADETISD